MTDTGGDMRTITLEKGLAKFIKALSGQKQEQRTVRAYQQISLSLSRFCMQITCRFIPPRRSGKLM